MAAATMGTDGAAGAARAAMAGPATTEATSSGPLEGAIAMPRGSSKKRERQYEHIKESYEERGRSEEKAEELAARTVNKQRREAGETKSSSRKSS
jgi:hypothetical protein